MKVSKIEADILEITGQDPQGKKEDRQKYFYRLIKATADLTDEQFGEELSEPAREWSNDATKARQAGKEMPDFPDKEPDEVEVEAAPDPVDEVEEDVVEEEVVETEAANDTEEEPVVVVTKKRSRSKKVAAAPKKAAKAPAAKKEAKVAKPKAVKVARAKVAKDANGKGRTRDGSKMAMIKSLLTRKNGCTARDVLDGTGWKAVGMPAMAKAVGLKLTKSKVKGEVTRYFGK